MTIFSERFVKLKRFSQEFDFDDTANQVIPKVGAGSVIGDILASIWTALSGKHPKITGGSDGQVYTVQPDGSYAWEGVASQIQTLGISGQTLSISGGNSVTLPDKDQQTLSVSGTTLSISGGNSVTLPSSGSVGSLFMNYPVGGGSPVLYGNSSTTYRVSPIEIASSIVAVTTNSSGSATITSFGSTPANFTSAYVWNSSNQIIGRFPIFTA